MTQIDAALASRFASTAHAKHRPRAKSGHCLKAQKLTFSGSKPSPVQAARSSATVISCRPVQLSG